MSGFDMGDLLGGFDGRTDAQRMAELNTKLAAKNKQAKRDTSSIPQMRSKTIEGVKYLRAEDVAEALRVTDSAVRVRVHIMKWLAK